MRVDAALTNSRKFASQSLADETIVSHDTKIGAGINSSIGSTKHNQTMKDNADGRNQLNITFQNQSEE